MEEKLEELKTEINGIVASFYGEPLNEELRIKLSTAATEAVNRFIDDMWEYTLQVPKE